MSRFSICNDCSLRRCVCPARCNCGRSMCRKCFSENYMTGNRTFRPNHTVNNQLIQNELIQNELIQDPPRSFRSQNTDYFTSSLRNNTRLQHINSTPTYMSQTSRRLPVSHYHNRRNTNTNNQRFSRTL